MGNSAKGGKGVAVRSGAVGVGVGNREGSGKVGGVDEGRIVSV